LLLTGSFTLKVPIQKVWDSLLKPETLGSCIPGCEKMEAVDEKTYDSIVGAKVGPISAKFKFRTTLTEIEPPTHLKAVGKGEELNKKGTFTQETVVDLKQISAEEVEVSYRSNVSIGGKLASFGDSIMKAKAKQLEGEFTQALRRRFSGEEIADSKLKVSTGEILTAFLSNGWQKIRRVFRSLVKG